MNHHTISIQLPETRPVTVYCEFQAEGNGYRVEIHVGADRAQSVVLPELAPLGRNETLQLGGGVQATLGEIGERLADGRWETSPWFEERGQFEIGRKLFDETVAQVGPLAACDQVDLRIVTDDEHLLRLPWPLLNRRGIFLIHEAWATSVSARTGPLPPITLAAHPRILVINPDPFPDQPTHGTDHVNDLRSLLGLEDLGSPANMVEVRTWQQLRDAVAAGPFDVVYYYGHGEGNLERTRLMFEPAGGGDADSRSIPDLANVLRALRPAPALAYVNCCRGDSAGLLGIGTQLGSFIPSVVTNRRVAVVAAARKQACSFFRQVLLDAIPPHDAVAALYRDLPGHELDGISPVWFTPIHHANYSQWHHEAPRRGPRINPNWRWLVDRKNQYGTTTERLRGMVQRQIKKRALAIVAYGAPGNGLVHFQQRIRVAVHESVGVGGNTYQPSWPPYQPRDDQDEALRGPWFQQVIQSCGQSRGRITLRELSREFCRGVAGNQALIVFNHAIVSRPDILNSRRLFEYIEWWDHELATEIEDESLFFLLAFYFEVPGGPKMRAAFLEKMRAARRQVQLQQTDVEFLLPLTEIEEEDLLQFIDDHELFIPRARRDPIARHIIRETDGEYERAVALLELIVYDQYHRLLSELRHQEEPAAPQEW